MISTTSPLLHPTPTSSTHSSSSSATGLLSMLSEPSPQLRTAALHRLLTIVDTQWHEIASSLPELEAIADNDDDTTDNNDSDNETRRQVAAAVASRVFFHLEEPNQALRLALMSSGSIFNLSDANERDRPYVECLIGAAMDAYVVKKQQEYENSLLEKDGHAQPSSSSQPQPTNDSNTTLDMDKLQTVVHFLFDKCCSEGSYSHALGVALEARQTSKVLEILHACQSQSTPGQHYAVLSYAFQTVHNLVTSKSFRTQIFQIVAEQLDTLRNSVPIGSTLHKNCVVSLSRSFQILKNSTLQAEGIVQLLDHHDDDDDENNDLSLLGLQICFDLIESGDSNYIAAVANALPKRTDNENTDAAETTTTTTKTRSEEVWKRYDNAMRILTGGFSTELGLSFLHKNSDSDRLIMENLKKALEERGGGRNSVLHNCAVVTHSYLNAGTTNDSFLRDNLDWMRKASNWAKFSATSSLGVLHAGHITEAMSLLEPYLPSNTAAEDPSGGFAEGGSLYALGIIHGSHSGGSATKRKEANDFLRNHLRSSHANEPISHGAALGVGLTAFGTNDLEIVNELKELLYTDSAVAGEGAGLAIGMVLVGSGAGNVENNLDPSIAEEIAEIITELKNYAKETQHEKIIRGIAMGLALINFGQEEHADPLIDEMRNNRDPVLRYGAQYALALAYCGTGSNKAIRILLHTAVSDANDDVRMAAVLGLAFVLYKTPDRVPQLVKLLLESFNPHVRYASCMAVGIAMAGSGDSESVALLEPMLSDMTDFVRQGALLGTALIYMQQNDACNGKKIKSFRDKLISIIGDKHQTSLTKMGAILATGIIDAGGRNCSFDLGSKNGFTKVTSAVGVALWLQHWYWFPLMHMFSLAITPTYTIGLNKDFKYPKNFEIICNSKPSVFSYPKRLEEKKEEKKKRIETVTLSTTAKTKAREARKKAKEEGESGPEKMVVEEVKTEEKEEGMEVDSDEFKTKKTKREPEPNSFKLSNPCRITKAQEPLCAFDSNQRYRAVYHDERPSGVIMLTDSTPGNEEDLGTVKPPSVEAEDEADPPEPFEWTPPGHPDYVSSD